MQRVSVALATALMLGGMSMAYAQGGPPQKENSPAQAQEQKGPSGGASRGAQAQENQGGSSKSESRADRGGAERSGGESQRSAGQSGQDGATGKSSRQQAQDEGGRKQKDSDRASKQDDDSKSAQRSGQDEEKSKRAQSKDDESSKRADRKDNESKGDKRAGKEDDQSKDQKRADQDGDRSKDAKRADRDDDKSKDAKRADRDDRSQDDRKRAEAGEGTKHVQLQGEKEERVRNVFRERANVRERTDVDIDIHVGSRLPRDWEYYPVPAAVIEVVPEYRNYRYVYVEDRYVIVDPDTYEVVTVISSDGSHTHAASSGRCSSDLALSADDRRYLLRTVQMQNVDVGDVTIGMDVPSSVELHTFPSSVTERVSILGSCRYFVTGDRIAIVDPNQHEVVVLID